MRRALKKLQEMLQKKRGREVKTSIPVSKAPASDLTGDLDYTTSGDIAEDAASELHETACGAMKTAEELAETLRNDAQRARGKSHG